MIQFLIQQKASCKIAFIITGFCFNTIMLVPEFYCVFSNSAFINTTLIKLQASHFIFVLINVAAATTLPAKQCVHFLVHANSIGLIFSLLMIPVCVFNMLLSIKPLINDGLMLLIFLVMTVQYKRMMRLIGLNKNYRLIITDAVAALLFISYLVWG